MKIKNIIKNASIVGIGALMLTNCASDYLDNPEHGVVESTQIASTTDKARAAMLGICVGMSNYWYDGGFEVLGPGQPFSQGEGALGYYLGEIPGQDAYINYIFDLAPNWVIYYNQEAGYINDGGYVWNRPMWLYCYANIAQANDLLYYINDAEGDEAMREFTKAQVYTMRAYYYYRLLQVYGPRWEDSDNGEKLCSVVLRTSIDEPNDKPVTTMNVILDLIYSDLDKAIECYQAGSSYKRSLNFEPNLNVAYGVYARVAALKHDWATCRDMAHNARQGYRVATTKEAMNGYTSFNTNEWMWAPSFEEVDNIVYCNWSTWFACNGYGANKERMTSSVDLQLYRQIPETDARRDWWLTVDKLSGINPAMAYSSKGVNPATGQFTAAALTNAARTWLDNHQEQYDLPGLPAYSGGKDLSIIRNGAQVKFWCNGLTATDGVAQIPFMRATEMYLLEAEACAELGESTKAQQLLEEINKPHNPSYTCNLTGVALRDEVRLYRRLELWGEGFSWFDYKRWNLPVHRLAWEEGDINSGNVPAELGALVPASRNNGWRHGIPRGERSYNNAITSSIPGETVSAD